MTTTHNLGILAFGSLIDNPGEEISEIEVDRIECKTPFNVEFARKSSKRGDAPTLIPFENGIPVKAVLFVLRNNIDINTAESILYRRERHVNNRTDIYEHSDNPGQNKVVIKRWENFMNVKTVLSTSIGCNITQALSPTLLANLAITSILSEAGQKEKDGIRYLLSTKRNGIVTRLSDDYEQQILAITDTSNLEMAIEKLDRKRNMDPKVK